MPSVAVPAEDAGVPRGTRVELDPTTREFARNILFGGSPARALRLSTSGVRALDELRAGTVVSPAAASLARRLIDAGMADPLPGPVAVAFDVTVIIPVRDRLLELEDCLQGLGGEHPVLVVDDESADPEAIAAVCSQHGARVARRSGGGGPGAARNFGLSLIRTEFVAFLDSDCVSSPGWISRLAGHLTDPLVAAVAPRIVPIAGTDRGAATRYASARSPLDLGDRSARVAPGTRVSYVPTAALLVRRAAIGEGFDEELRYGEDVDLVWRLVDAGWRVRYDPTVQVAHREPSSWSGLLRRRYRYGTSVVPLTRRHPGATSPLVLQPWSALTVLALLARRPLCAAATCATGTGLIVRRLRTTGLGWRQLTWPMASSLWPTFLGLGRWCGQFASPVLVLLLVRPGARGRTRRRRRVALGMLLLCPGLSEWARRRPKLDPFRFGLGVLADEAAYGAGVWRQCLRDRLWSPLVPSTARTASGLTAQNKSDYHSSCAG